MKLLTSNFLWEQILCVFFLPKNFKNKEKNIRGVPRGNFLVCQLRMLINLLILISLVTIYRNGRFKERNEIKINKHVTDGISTHRPRFASANQ